MAFAILGVSAVPILELIRARTVSVEVADAEATGITGARLRATARIFWTSTAPRTSLRSIRGAGVSYAPPARRHTGDGDLGCRRAADPSRFVGRVVQWTGTVVEVAAERDRFMAESGGLYFATRVEGALPDEVQRAVTVEVEGIVLERGSKGVVLLEAQRVRLLPQGPLPAPRALPGT